MSERLKKTEERELSLSEVHGSVDTMSVRKKGFFKKFLAFAGPAYLVSVGYMDPGNWATDLRGGSEFGYTLIWVLLMSNIMALLLQSLSARLGIVRGRDLAQANREAYPRGSNFALYILAEVAIAATDLAEVLGMAIGLHLLTGIPLFWGVAITVLDTFLLLFLQRLGMRKMEIFIIGLVVVIGLSFLVEIILAGPNLREVASGFVPRIPNDAALYVAIGIIGATVMPHNLYLHSALVQTRKIPRDKAGIKQALRMNFADSAIALNLAFLVNAAILILAATVFFKSGRTDVARIEDAYLLLPGFLGTTLASKLFAIALIAAGQSSTITGTLAGQIVMEGYLRLRLNPWLRRLLTRMLAILPALLVIGIYGDGEVEEMLVLSQVILSLQLGFAIIPLIHFVSDRQKMQGFAIGIKTKIAAWLIAGILVYLNLRMVIEQSRSYFESSGATWYWKTSIVLAGAGFILFLLYITFHPLIKKARPVPSIQIHPPVPDDIQLTKPVFNRIGLALDFSKHDEKLLSHALSQGHNGTTYLLIHVVESASARMLGSESADYETEQDRQLLDRYRQILLQQGFAVETRLGYNDRVREIVRIAKEERFDMLIIGSHGHKGIKDFIHGETVNSVRHELQIPILIVNA